MIYIDALNFLGKSKYIPVIDVRSPSEFSQGHIPGAFNVPLFDDEERKKVGILYKNSGREASVLLGLEFAGPKMAGFVKEVRKIVQGKDILIHCWRGGMRSNGMAWLLEIAGYNISVLEGGYKAYRRFIRLQLGEPFHLLVLGGYTGSGKTEVLHLLKARGEQVIDLEAIANHKGSAFGDIGQQKQPTNEQFENDVYKVLQEMDRTQPLWVEDESRSIGTVSIPDPFFIRMKASPLIFLEIGRIFRIPKLVGEYAGHDPGLLKKAIDKISEKLGGLNAKLAMEAVDNKDFTKAVELVLEYYDKAYRTGLQKRNRVKVIKIKTTTLTRKHVSQIILEAYKNTQQQNL
jgi:tRNA 2-selenouridine synthase